MPRAIRICKITKAQRLRRQFLVVVVETAEVAVETAIEAEEATETEDAVEIAIEAEAVTAASAVATEIEASEIAETAAEIEIEIRETELRELNRTIRAIEPKRQIRSRRRIRVMSPTPDSVRDAKVQ